MAKNRAVYKAGSSAALLASLPRLLAERVGKEGERGRDRQKKERKTGGEGATQQKKESSIGTLPFSSFLYKCCARDSASYVLHATSFGWSRQ